MAVLDLPAPEGAVTPVAAGDIRPSLVSGEQRFSSPAAQADDVDIGKDQTVELAAELGASERALRTAQGLLQRHLARAGKGQVGTLTATLDGIRRACLTAPGLMVRGRGEDLRFGVALIADPLVLLAVGGAQAALHWSLLPGGPSVTSRADGLRLVRGLAAGGHLTFQMGGHEALPPLEFGEGLWEDEDEWRLFEDLAVLEEWSGVTIPMPAAVSADEATTAAQAASSARTEQIDARITDAITFAVTADATPEKPDELRLHQEFGLHLLGAEIPLGEGVARVALSGVAQENAEKSTYRAWPARSDVSFLLRPPPNRRLPTRRTQPERVSPPVVRLKTERPLRRAFQRAAGRQLAEVLAERRIRGSPGGRLSRGTSELLDDIRGD